VKTLAKTNMKSYSHHRGKDAITPNAKAVAWNGRVSESAHHVVIKVLGLISEKIRHLGRQKEHGLTDFMCDSLHFFPGLSRMRIADFDQFNFYSVFKAICYNSQFDFEVGNSGDCQQHAEISRWLWTGGDLSAWRIGMIRNIKSLCGALAS
jgi:hypothetical protein